MALSINDLKHVRGFLYGVRKKWYDIGVELDVVISDLDNIPTVSDDPGESLLHVLKVRLKSATPLTWTIIGDALSVEAINEVALAEEAYSKATASGEGDQVETIPQQDTSEDKSVESQPSENQNENIMVPTNEDVTEAIPIKKLDNAIRKHSSYHGTMNGDEAEATLQEQNTCDCCYLTRYSEVRDEYILSVLLREDGESVFKNFIIISNENDYEISGSEEKFANLDELLEFYKKHPLLHNIDGIGEEITKDVAATGKQRCLTTQESEPALDNGLNDSVTSMNGPESSKKLLSKEGTQTAAVPLWAIKAMHGNRSFHGSMSNIEAAIKLIEYDRNCYLTRYSDFHKFCVISVMKKREDGQLLQHFKLNVSLGDNEQSTYKVVGTEEEFSTFDELLEHYQKNSLKQFGVLGECLRWNMMRLRSRSLPDLTEEQKAVEEAEQITINQDMRHPTFNLLKIIRWTDDKGDTHDFKLIEQISQRWWKAGMLLSLSKTTLDLYRDKAENDVKSCEYVFKNWVDHKGHKEYPLTWVGLHTLLIDMGRRTAADKLYSLLRSKSDTNVDTLCNIFPF